MGRKNYLIDSNVAIFYFGMALSNLIYSWKFSLCFSVPFLCGSLWNKITLRFTEKTLRFTEKKVNRHILWINQAKESEKFIDQILSDRYSISVINRIELLGFKGLSGNESEALNSFISNSTIFDLEEDIILETIKIRKMYKIKLPDAIIAATCLINNYSLITNNIKDFDRIVGLHFVKV